MADYAISSAIHFAFSGTKLRLFRRRLLQGNVKHGAEIFNGVPNLDKINPNIAPDPQWCCWTLAP
jgi:hypothetical protein